MEFQFSDKNGGVCVTGLLEPGAACVIPKTLGGRPVTELSDRLFAQSVVEEVWFPESLKRIGRYAFYGCEHLKRIHFYSGLTEVGGGVLNGSQNVSELFVHGAGNTRTAVRDFVTELSGRVTVHFLQPTADGKEAETARLIFPAFYDEAVENTPARITVSAIHGSGQKYRYCFEGGRVRFDRYDGVFSYEKAEEPVALAAEIAVCRLRYPAELREGGRAAYREFLREHFYETFTSFAGDLETEKWLLREFFGKDSPPLSPGQMDAVILQAAQRKDAELSGILMEFKRTYFAPVRRKFEL